MRKLLVLGAILLAGCHNTDVKYKVLIGATATLASGTQPVDDAVIVIAGKKIRAAGKRASVPIPQNSDRTDLGGRWIVPAGSSPLAPEEPANLLILDHAPNGITPANPADVGARIQDGEWFTPDSPKPGSK